MVKIYTRSGDEGNTHLFGGERVSKQDLRVRAYGAVDELNSYVGIIRSECENDELTEILTEIQSLLFVCGADLASPKSDDEDTDENEREKRIKEKDVTLLEDWIDRFTDELDPISNFILPGGTSTAARLHMARSICRRAEREAVYLKETEQTSLGSIVPFLNRLSDFFFTLARYCNHESGTNEIPWNAPLSEDD